MEDPPHLPLPENSRGAAAIDVRGLAKLYERVRAVDHISFTVAPGEVVGLLGGNGAGKTTTIAMLMGLVTPSAGEVGVLGIDMARHRHKVLHRINFESPYVDMPMRLTVRQNLTCYAMIYGLEAVARRVAEVAEQFELNDFLDRRSGSLSAGQKTRVSIAKALLNEPELLLLDEPTASLDPDTADWIRSHIEAYRARRGATILLASHNMPEVERMCDRVIMMKQGRIVDEDTPVALIRRYGRASLEDVFLDVARGTGAGAMAGS